MKSKEKKSKRFTLKMMNSWLKGSIIALVVLTILAVVFVAVLRYTNSRLNIEPVSAFVKYADWCEPINDATYLDSAQISTLEGYPTLTFENGTVSFNIKECDDFHMTYIYTGSEKFVYADDLWDKLVKEGKKHPEVNSSQGWMATNANSVKLTRDGWYTVFGIWYENGQKHYIVNCFNKNMRFVNAINEEAIAAYERWSENKNSVKAKEGIEHYLIVGADEWTKNVQDDIFSDAIILATVNHTNKSLSFTSISKETYVYIPGIGAGRIANAYHCGGIELLLQTVRENFGIDIDNYFAFDYECFISLVDAFGGVDFALDETEAAHINHYVDLLYQQYDLSGTAKDHYITAADGSAVKLDGIQALSYLRSYYEGDFARAERYQQLLENLRPAASLKNIAFLAREVFPHISTDLEFEEYRELLFDAQIAKAYSISYTSIPETNRIADFKENGQYTVLLTSKEEVQQLSKRLNDNGGFHPDPTNLHDILAVCFWSANALLVALMIYLIFAHQYKVVFILDNQTYTKAKRYRFGKKVHLYHNDLPGKIVGFYANPEMTLELDEDTTMPMKTLVVYAKAKKDDSKK